MVAIADAAGGVLDPKTEHVALKAKFLEGTENVNATVEC